NGNVFHCKCAKCFSLPTKRKIKKHPPVFTLLGLPDDVLLYVLECLPAEDILNFRAVHSHFRSLVDNHASVWAHANFHEVWPSPINLWLFERAAESGNFEAAVKLGIAYLYNEGLAVSDEGRAEINGLKASHFFSLAESLNVSATPFVWLFIRPPWSLTGSCCKAVVYESLKSENLLSNFFSVCLRLDEEKLKEAVLLFEESSNHGCLTSSYHLWETNQKGAMTDPGRYLQSLRKLRDYAIKGCWEAQLSLAKACGNGNLLDIMPEASKEPMAQIFQSSHPFYKQNMFKMQKNMNDTMRYILVDWLVEVTSMKDFSSLCLHVTVACVDRYLMLRCVPRARLQLLGIACMVISTRFISKEILTIREAVWLTDNTYKYEDLVRMMGEIISALEGKIRTPTVLDYAGVLLTVAPLERRTAHLFNYICELSLLYTDLSVYSPAMTAAAGLLLARILLRQALPWSSQLMESTGFTLDDLTPCVINLHKKCFHNEVPRDYRHVSLTAVKQRFEDERHQQISKEKVNHSHGDLCSLLGVKEDEKDASSYFSHTNPDIQTFLTSPSGNKTKRRREDSLREDRGNFVATPIVELSNQEDTLLGDYLDWSLDLSCAGYEGDQESEGEKNVDVCVLSEMKDSVAVGGNLEHCCEDTSEESDEDGLRQNRFLRGSRKFSNVKCEAYCSAREFVASSTFREPPEELSSGYSSVSSNSSSSTSEVNTRQPLPSTSGLSPTIDFIKPMPSSYSTEDLHLADELPSVRREYRTLPSRRKPIKRKNGAEHDKEEWNLGFLSL
uniref:Cyclin-F n=1 Tax=Callorhinchus milii TaxID=7868 RepID=A0A4W3HJN8_CALMI